MSRAQQAKKGLPRSFVHVASRDGIEEYVLKKNGLRVLFRHDDSSPVVGVMVTYLIGSRHEATGHTGSTHILEHLMFKGSKQFPPRRGTEVLDMLSKKGAMVNASTWLDRTNYYEVLPVKHFEFAVRIEADRMRHAFITKRDLAEELPAVLSEHAMSTESNPVNFLDERVWATAFLAHPYHHSTLGWFSDIEHASVEKLKGFYNTYYYSNNAVVTVVGDIKRYDALRTIEKYFGVHKKATHAFPQPHTKEPEQHGKRSVSVERAGTKNIVAFAFKVPEALHEDTPAILALSSILGGGKTSRFYRALVEKSLASKAWVSYIPFHDPSLFEGWAMIGDGVTHEKIEKAMMDVCESVIQNGVQKEELDRIRALLLTDIALSRDGHYAMLSTLNEAIAVGDWRFYFSLPEALEKITPKDVQRVAKKYLSEKNMTVGYYRARKA